MSEQMPAAWRWIVNPGDVRWSFGAYAPSNAAKSEPLYTAAPQPAPGWEEATGYAERLSVALWEKHYKTDADQWKPLSGDLIGILTQIDNMTTGLSRSSQSTSDAGGGVREALEDLQHFSTTQLERNPKMQGVVATVVAALSSPSSERRDAIARIFAEALDCSQECKPATCSCRSFADDAILALSNPAAADSNASAEAKNALYWAVGRWNAEVLNRPLRNIHRRSLDDTWRQVIRHFGGDDRELCGPTHDELLDAPDHASNCEKQGETIIGGSALCGHGVMAAICEVCNRPSDRPADVTEDDLVRVIKGKAQVDFGGWETDLARALLDTYKVSRP